jgi:arylsulfatase A-like enzyme
VRDNTPVDPPGTFATGYHLTADLVDQSIRYLADHIADRPEVPWLTWLAFGACHAPHQAPFDLIRKYDALFAEGWDAERDRRLARQKETGIVPKDTRLPPRNDAVRPWAELPEGERRLYARLQAAYAAMLEHADQHLARLVKFLEDAGQLDDTMIVVMSDNGASQEGGPFGMINAMGPYNLRREPLEEKIARIEDIGGPDTHSNFPLGWAMAANTPLRRYKQNTHGGGIRDPLVISWPKGVAARGELRHQFCHASDLAPTLLEVVGVKQPEAINGVAQMPIEGTSFAPSLLDAKAPAKSAPQYFEMFGHRGLWRDGWKAVSFHPPGTDFDKDKWELFHLDRDFSETDDLAEKEPQRLKALIDAWWKQAEAHQVLPLDDRFQARFGDNAKRFHGPRRKFVFHAGMGHVPTDVAPDVRSRTYTIEADARIDGATTEGVLIAHGDMTCGYSLYIKDNRLTYDMNVGGVHHIAVSDRPVPAGNHVLGLRMRRNKGINIATLLIDGEPAGGFESQLGFVSFISWSGLDIGRDRSSPVSHYEAPFAFTGKLRKVTVTLDDDQVLDSKSAADAALARE